MKITAVVSVLTRRRGEDPNHPLNKAIPFDNQLFLKVQDHHSQDIIQHFPGVCDFINKRLVCLLFYHIVLYSKFHNKELFGALMNTQLTIVA